ncbi:hypothetical protein [Thalassomonas haliotis]|uniref:Uncharacterized protein n=1 Tax=Thalassomonas haliotis TaxID=485448 RepID=A0ABY7VBE4_9GAMM|nr:hypothetical protein [Thalassomonas haliotis]WDE10555.1 hypothetical protein H3N35_20155 [Thalassomonas haliotis]
MKMFLITGCIGLMFSTASLADHAVTYAPKSQQQMSAVMDLTSFQTMAYDNNARCFGEITGPTVGYQELDFALSRNLITTEAYRWGRENGYYPVIDRFDNIRMVCHF